ncbi:MAG: helix-turn-helix domain-containing protein [Acetobacteraceae bacterium]
MDQHPDGKQASVDMHGPAIEQKVPVKERERPHGRAVAADRHVGMRIRERRLMLGLSQQQLAHLIGVTYQQAHKYERGLNRISAGRLFEIAQVLQVPISWFFEGIDDGPPSPGLTVGQRRVLELARNFAAISNERHQEALSEMARVLAAQAVAERSP